MTNLKEFISTELFEVWPSQLPISGNSMRPCYFDGQRVCIKPIHSQKLTSGRCYIYQNRGSLVIHRLVHAFSTYALFAGDANITIEYVNLDTIIGITEDNNNLVLMALIAFVNYFFLPFKNFNFIFRLRKFILKIIIKVSSIYEERV